MNCKPGDLALLVNSDFETNIGKLVKVLKTSDESTPEIPEWECEAIGFLRSYQYIDDFLLCERPTNPGELIDIEDRDLRPIRDPGDDAVDEVIQRMGTPHKETA